MTGLFSELGEESVFPQKVFLFVRLKLVTMREGSVSCLGAIQREIRGSGFSLSHTEYVPPAFCLEHLIISGSLIETQYRTGCLITLMRKHGLRG